MSDTAALLDALASYFSRFVVLSPEQLAALVLWTAHTYVYEIADTTPYLIVTSAEKRSGKTRMIEAVQHVAHKPQTVAALTEAVLFRLVSQDKPTLLIDETDAIFRDSRGGPNERQEGLRAILNAGYRRGTLIPRMTPRMEIAHFACYCPKLLAGIGHLPDTIEDRGVNIRLERRKPEDVIERLRFREVSNGTTHELREGLSAWAPGARLALEGNYPAMPDELDDRAQDSYEILIAIADHAGSAWGERSRDALVALRTADIGERESQGIRLLRDMGLIAEKLGRMERIATADLLALLYADGLQPWEEWWGECSGKRAARRLALALGEYGVRPAQLWIDGANMRGYVSSDILALVERYSVSNTLDMLETPDLQGNPSDGNARNEPPPSVLESADLQGSSVSSVSDAEKPLENWPW